MLAMMWKISLPLLLLATPAWSACMDKDGTTLPTLLEVPTFEDSAEAIQTALNATILTASLALDEVLSLSSDFTVQQERAGYPLTFENTLGALDKMQNEMALPAYRFYFLSRVSDQEEIRNAAQAAFLTLVDWSRDFVDYNQDIYNILVEYNTTAELEGEAALLLNDTLKGYQRRGMALSEEDRTQLQSWQEDLTQLTNNISTNINMAVGAAEFTVEQLQGLSDQQLAELSYNETTELYTALTAISSQYRTVITYANNSDTRLQVTKARMQRAVDENGDLILKVLQTRQQIAALLGFDHWADYKTADKMAKTGATALEFITNIDERLQDQFEKEQDILLELKQEDLGDPSVDELHRYDIGFYKNILLERDYQIDQELVAEYFEEEATLKGIFDLYEELFNITIVYDKDTKDVWADDVQLVYIYDKDGTEPLGGVYLDLHPREAKYKHFAKFSIVRGHHTTDKKGVKSYQAPMCAIVGNWPVAVGNVSVPLWRFGNVNTMLHEFGHALHTILTCAEFTSYAGTSVPRDFVEVPSQMLERWLDDINVVRRFAKHYQTGDPMPEHLLQSLIDARMLLVGHAYKGQVSYGKADLNIHTYETADDIPSTPMELYEETNKDYAGYYPVPEDTAMIASFGHLFGGYDAGYYGYAWADAIAADLASLFRASPEGFMDQQLGAKFRKEILEPGGSRDPNDSIRAFLGRDWNTNAFFAEMGLPQVNTNNNNNAATPAPTSSRPANSPATSPTSGIVETGGEEEIEADWDVKDPAFGSNLNEFGLFLNGEEDDGREEERDGASYGKEGEQNTSPSQQQEVTATSAGFATGLRSAVCGTVGMMLLVLTTMTTL